MRLNYFKVEASQRTRSGCDRSSKFFPTIRKLRDLNARHFDKTNPAVEDGALFDKEKPVKKIR
jgi:hypothetical protein